MRLLRALMTLALLCVGVAACGGASRGLGSVSQAASSTATDGSSATTPADRALTRHSFKGDEDDDDQESKTFGQESSGDKDADPDNDYKDNQNKGYYDKDDSEVRTFGQPADPADKRAITAVVRRFDTAAATGEGATACLLIYSVFAQTIVEGYGHGAGPSYLSGGNSCPSVMTLLFKHDHSELTGAVKVTGVRIKGKSAYALQGSVTRPASYFMLRHEGSAWKIDGLLSSPLP